MFIIKFFVDDFKSCRHNMREVLNRKVPLWIFVIYYITFASILLPLAPLSIGYKWYIERRIRKMFEEV